ncbi:hypothetical protein ES703_80577 [subsurface metagenome]
MLNKASTGANGAGRAVRQPEGATEVAGAYTDRGSSSEAGAAFPVPVREAYEDALWGGGDDAAQLAAIQRAEHGAAGVCSHDALTSENPTNDFQKAVDRYDRVVGWYALKSLLQPVHPFFEGKEAYLDGFRVYRRPGAETWLAWPQISGPRGGRMPLGNPYRLRKVSRSHTARKIKALFAVADASKVMLRIAHVMTSCPKPISEWAIEKKSRRQVMWKELGRPFLGGLEDIVGSGLGADSNYHTWSSECPVEPHSHFHHQLTNLRMVEAPGALDEDGEQAYHLEEIPWVTQRGGNRYQVPFSDQQLVLVKQLWLKLLRDFVRKHKIDWQPPADDDAEGWREIYVNVVPKDGKMKMMGSINYCGRNPIEDYAVYSNKVLREEHAVCPDPPEWLLKYSNRSRPFGWWRNLKTLAGSRKEEREKLHPLTGERLEYLGSYNLRELLERNQLGFLDVVKGKPVFSLLRDYELDWLLSVVKSRSPPYWDDYE